MVVLEKYWQDTRLVFEVSLGSFTCSFQFNRMWTAPHFPTPPKNNLNQPSSTYDYLVTKVSPCGHTLSLLYIDPSSVVHIVYKALPELSRYFQNQISRPTLPEWRNLMGNWKEFPNVVGAIDTRPHEIYRPLIEPQRPFYSGYWHYHCMNTQLVMDNEGHIRFVQAGFPGSTHDAVSFLLMEPIGPGCNLDLPPNAKLLADKAYPDGRSLLTPVRANQMPLLNQRNRRRARRFNTLLSKRRVKIEHVFKEMKTYKVIGQIWQQPRWLMPVCVELVALLFERRVRLFKTV